VIARSHHVLLFRIHPIHANLRTYCEYLVKLLRILKHVRHIQHDASGGPQMVVGGGRSRTELGETTSEQRTWDPKRAAR
jgi:hypothetical protein